MPSHARLRMVAGYSWYDWNTGAIDLLKLATSATRTEAIKYAEVPEWMPELPSSLPDAWPIHLARIDALARRAYVHKLAAG